MGELQLVKGYFICPECKSRDLYVRIEYKPDANVAFTFQECFECGHKGWFAPNYEAVIHSYDNIFTGSIERYPHHYNVTWDIPVNIPTNFSVMDYYKQERLKEKVKE